MISQHATTPRLNVSIWFLLQRSWFHFPFRDFLDGPHPADVHVGRTVLLDGVSLHVGPGGPRSHSG